jgi:hypothetical protein
MYNRFYTFSMHCAHELNWLSTSPWPKRVVMLFGYSAPIRERKKIAYLSEAIHPSMVANEAHFGPRGIAHAVYWLMNDHRWFASLDDMYRYTEHPTECQDLRLSSPSSSIPYCGTIAVVLSRTHHPIRRSAFSIFAFY